MKANKIILIFSCILVFVFLIDGCKQKGCTDKSAMNYNIAAQDDDGTCIYCTTKIQPDGSVSAYLIDNNSSSSHYNQTVAIFNVSQVSKSYNYVSCGSDSCVLYLNVQNLVNQEIVFNYDLFTGAGDFFGFSD